jgi:inward rectifier potassium channel
MTTDVKFDSKEGRPHAGHDHTVQPSRGRIPQKRGVRRPKPIIRGQDGTQWKDIYHWVLTVPWWAFFLALAGFFVLLNTIFAFFYFADPNGLLNARPGNFWDMFFFSVQTIGSLNSPMLPKSDYTRAVMSVEAFCGIVNLALVTGVVFARFSRPFARIVFSKVAVVVPFDGVPTLMFRAANQRTNVIFDATATVSLARQMTNAEGMAMRRFEELKLVRNRTPLFSLSWTVMHPIDSSSPLYGVDLDAFYEQEMELIVLLSGTDETLSQVIYARQRYSPEDILFDQRFVDVLTTAESGRTEVDLRRFHDTVALPPA